MCLRFFAELLLEKMKIGTLMMGAEWITADIGHLNIPVRSVRPAACLTDLQSLWVVGQNHAARLGEVDRQLWVVAR